MDRRETTDRQGPGAFPHSEEHRVSTDGDSITTPLVRGLLAALSVLGIALAVVVVPALAAQVAGTASSATALDAVLIALSILVLGHGGGVVLSTGVIDGAVTLTPVGLQVLLVLLAALSLRRAGRRLQLVRDDGVLRVGALRDAGVTLAAFAGAYAIGLAVLAAIGRSAEAAPVVTSALVSGALVAVGGGLIGLLWSLRREATSTVPGVRVLGLLPAPYDAVARAALIALLGLIGSGMLLVIVLALTHVPAQAALFDQLAPGFVGGLVLLLLQLALLPLLAVWALAVLLGGTVVVGTSTGISLGETQTGVLPALPILGILPEPGDLPFWTWGLMLLPAVAVGVGAVSLVRDVAELEMRERRTAWIAYPAVVVVAVLLLAGLATGGIGEGRLVHLGPQMSTLVLPLLGVVVVATGLVLAVRGTALVPWTRERLGALRGRVEAAETRERGEAADRGATTSSAGSASTAGSAGTASSAGSASAAGSAAAADPSASSAGSALSPQSPAGSAMSAESATESAASPAPSAVSPAASPMSPARSAVSPAPSAASPAASAASPASSAQSAGEDPAATVSPDSPADEEPPGPRGLSPRAPR